MLDSLYELPSETGPESAFSFIDGRTRYSLCKTGAAEWTLYGHFRADHLTPLSLLWKEGDRWVAKDLRGGRKIRNVSLAAVIEGCLT